MPQPETLRTFIAVPLSSSVIEELNTLERELKRACPRGAVKWVPPDRIHLTLHFLGDILPNRLAPIKEALNVVARNVPTFTFEAANLGAFPNPHRPRVIWVGVRDESSWLALLHEAVNEAMERLGFERERRKFSPHLTLGRVRRRAGAQEARAIGQVLADQQVGRLGQVAVKKLIFFQSVLRSTGAEYSPLAEFPLADV